MLQDIAPLLALGAAFFLVLLWRERSGRAARRGSEAALAALRESEGRFRDFAEAASDWLWETDAEGRFVYVSKNGFTQLGLGPDALLGRRREEMIAGARDKEALARHLEDFRARRPFRNFVFWIEHPTGLLCLSASATPAFDADGRFRGYRGTTRDVTAEALAREQLVRLAGALDGSEDAIVATDLAGDIVVWNKGAERLYGWSAEEALGGPLLSLISPPGRVEETAAEMAQLRERISAGERVEPFDAIRARRDGSTLQVSLTITPLKDTFGAVVGTIGIGRDVSARLAFEAELRAERERSQDFAEAASDWFWETDAELRVSFVSARFTELTGVSADERIGRPWIGIPQDDPEKWRDLAATFAARLPFRDFRFSRPGPGGTKREISASGKPCYGRNGEFLGYRGTGKDVTQEVDARRAAEQAEIRLRAALENIAEGFALFDADDRLVFCNGQYRVLSGRAATVLMQGVRFEDYLRAGLAGGEMPEAIGAEEDWLRRRLAYHRAPHGSMELLRSGRWLRLVETRLPDGGTILIAADITDERRREQRLREAQKMEAIGRLTGGVAHDFNNLLAVILGNTELLEERLDGNPEARKLARNSIRAALRGAELTQRLLAFARRQPLKPEATDLNQLVAGVAELLRRTLGANIEIETRLADALPRIEVDPGQLENALLNLAFNARDAMPAGGRLVVATGEAERAPEVEGAGGFVTASVTDSGVGMTAEVAARAFEPFFTTKEPGKGSGLGLSMVYGFARQSSGGLALDSAPGVGTTITLYLPRSTAPEEGASEEAHAPSAAGGERVLLVEDADDVRELARTMLEGLGYSVVEARDGPAAYALLERDERFDLLLTDVMLPGGVNGADLARSARARWPKLKVLCMSGYSEQAPRLAAGDARLPLLSKPFRRAELAKAIREALAS